MIFASIMFANLRQCLGLTNYKAQVSAQLERTSSCHLEKFSQIRTLKITPTVWYDIHAYEHLYIYACGVECMWLMIPIFVFRMV